MKMEVKIGIIYDKKYWNGLSMELVHQFRSLV
jgi:hypothetical protein